MSVCLSYFLSFQASKCWNRLFGLIHRDWLTGPPHYVYSMSTFSSGVLKSPKSARHTVICLLLTHKRRTESATYVFQWYMNVGKCRTQHVSLLDKRRKVPATVCLPKLFSSIAGRWFPLPCFITLARGQGLQQILSMFLLFLKTIWWTDERQVLIKIKWQKIRLLIGWLETVATIRNTVFRVRFIKIFATEVFVQLAFG